MVVFPFQKFSGDFTALLGRLASSQLDMESKTVAGVFAGYNWQRNNWVLGGELAYSNPDQSIVMTLSM